MESTRVMIKKTYMFAKAANKETMENEKQQAKMRFKGSIKTSSLCHRSFFSMNSVQPVSLEAVTSSQTLCKACWS